MIDRIKTLFASNAFLSNVSRLVSGTLLSQLILLLSMPILTRLYTPEAFGLMAAFIAISHMLSPIACARYEIAIPLAENEDEAIALFLLSIVCAFVAYAIFALISITFSDVIAEGLNQPDLAPLTWMIAVSIAATGVYNAAQFFSLRHNQYARVARTRIVRTAGSSGSQVGLGLLAPTGLSLVIGQLIYVLLGVGNLMRFSIQKSWPRIKVLPKSALLHVMRKYRRFPLFSVPEALSNSAAMQVPVLLIVALTNSAEAGFLFLAMRIVVIPMSLVGASVGQVFMVEAPKAHLEGRLLDLTLSTIKYMFLSGAVAFSAIAVGSYFLFPFVFGQEWARSGVMVAFMMPWFLVQFVSTPIGYVLHTTGAQHLAFLIQFLGLILRVSFVLAAHYLLGGYEVEAFAASGFVAYLINLLVILVIAHKSHTPHPPENEPK